MAVKEERLPFLELEVCQQERPERIQNVSESTVLGVAEGKVREGEVRGTSRPTAKEWERTSTTGSDRLTMANSVAQAATPGPDVGVHANQTTKEGAVKDNKKKTYDGLSFSKFMFAGSAAGIAEHVAMFPVDTIKTRMQAIPAPGVKLSNTVATAMSSIIRKEGFMGLYSGVGTVAVGAGPSHGLYFVVYEYMKNFLGASNDDTHRPLETSVAAAIATVIADGFMTPLDVVKQRLQLPNNPYKSAMDCASSMFREEGLRPFFRSYNTTVIMNVPFVSIHFAAYESCKKLLRKSAEDEGLMTQIVAGGIAGGAAALATNPLDVVKTRLQTEGVGGIKYGTSSTFGMLKNIVKTEGYGALMHGMRPRVLFHAPAAAISWMTYETCKNILQV